MKNLLFALAFIIISSTTFSQVKIRPGVKMGLNMSTLTNTTQASRKGGEYAGLFVNIHLAKFYELQIETMYSNQGATIKYIDFLSPYDPLVSSYSLEDDINLQYVGLSIANKFFIVPDMGLNIIIGPSIDILVGDNYGEATPVDFALFGGIGYEFPFGLGIELRYKQGLIDIRDGYYDDNYYYYDDYNYDYNYDNDYYDGDNVLNGVIQLGVSYRFEF